MKFELQKLNYAYDALEPLIDAQTMEIHHTKHHAAYTNNLNAAIEGTSMFGKTIEQILELGAAMPPAVRNNGGGFYNHNLYFDLLTPGGSTQPVGLLSDAIARDFGSLEKLKELFTNAALTRFGSGWAWLINQNGKLVVASTPNQDNPLMSDAAVKGVPILGIDVWEHAYYLKYQNKRADYAASFWKLINWDLVSNLYHV